MNATHETHGMNRRRTVDVLGYSLTHDRATSVKLGRDVYVWRATVRHGLTILAQHHETVRGGGWILSASCLGQSVTVCAATFAGAHSKLGDEIVWAPKIERALRLGREVRNGGAS